MKYGQQLSRRSVPEWRAHNILYNDLKDEIKRVTSKPVSRKAHDKLEEWFVDEFNNVRLFIKSKNGEIDFRITRCEKLVDSIAELDGKRPEPDTASSTNSQIVGSFYKRRTDLVDDMGSPARDSKVYQLHREISRLTRDIQQLSRFIGAQHTGFSKLIKKYRKWSDDPTRLTEFEHLLEGPESFTRIDFTPRFLELSLLYDMIRSGHFKDLETLREELTHHGHTNELENTTLVDQLLRFDTTMLSSMSQTVKLWIHPDNLMELKVVLLEHMGLISGSSDKNQHNNITYLDTRGFDYAQSRKEPGCIVSVSLFPEDGSAETSSSVLCAPTGGLRHFTTKMLSPSLEKTLRQGKLRASDLENEDNNGKLALGWYLNREVAPTAELRTTRSRFVLQERQGTAERDPTKTWAVIDSDITVLGTESAHANFPYSVLEIRWTGSGKPDWIAKIEKSHLVYPVSTSFGLDTYALLVKKPEIFVGVPSWMSVLERGDDIRRAPESTPKIRPAKSMHRLRPQNSRGILLNDRNGDNGENNKDNSVRYWNEFDHPDEEDGGDAFAVFIDDEYENFRRSQVAEKLSQPVLEFSKRVRQSFAHIKALLGIEDSVTEESTSPAPSERDSLLSSDEFDAGGYSPRIHPSNRSGYESFPEETLDGIHGRYDAIMVMLSSLSFCLAVFLAFVSFGILLGDDGQTLPIGIKLVIIIGLTFSMVFSGLGTMLYYLQTRTVWAGEVIVYALLLGLICVGVGGIALIAAY